MKPTKEQILAYVETLKAIYEAIKGAGERGIPSGHLYAVLMGEISLDTYNSLKNKLIQLGLITEENYLLKVKK